MAQGQKYLPMQTSGFCMLCGNSIGLENDIYTSLFYEISLELLWRDVSEIDELLNYLILVRGFWVYGVLTPFSLIYQLHRGGQFYWWR